MLPLCVSVMGMCLGVNQRQVHTSVSVSAYLYLYQRRVCPRVHVPRMCVSVLSVHV